MLPAPPRPAAYLVLVCGSLEPKREAGPKAVVASVVFGVLKVLPAPPRPECM